MRNIFAPFALLLTLSGHARADIAPPPSVMAVDPRCTISVGNGTINYGTQTKAQLQSSGPQLTPGKRTLMLSVACPFAREIRLGVQGDRTGDGSLRYGDLGQLKVRLVDAQLDGQPVALREISTGGQSEEWNLSLKAGTRFEVSHNSLPLNGKSFSARLEIEPLISETAARVSHLTTSEARLSFDLLD
ncbi:fimbrial protein [Cedecea neteri]|uniref:fimbrial protein n=1 Tax=Cedecea neteri TaxID=158822 RepID=UPI002892D609|nr:fimbrial protein [Cedecea neteri]WNJ78476.1 fimbrial protein [Cedecea neteri]